MQILLIGLSHRTAPVDLRERVDFGIRGLPAALEAIGRRGTTAEAVVVSTCNRAEIYAACEEPRAARDDLAAFVGDFHGVAAAEIACAITRTASTRDWSISARFLRV